MLQKDFTKLQQHKFIINYIIITGLKKTQLLKV